MCFILHAIAPSCDVDDLDALGAEEIEERVHVSWHAAFFVDSRLDASTLRVVKYCFVKVKDSGPLWILGGFHADFRLVKPLFLETLGVVLVDPVSNHIVQVLEC